MIWILWVSIFQIYFIAFLLFIWIVEILLSLKFKIKKKPQDMKIFLPFCIGRYKSNFAKMLLFQVLQLALNFLNTAVSHSHTWIVIKPHAQVFHVFLPFAKYLYQL